MVIEKGRPKFNISTEIDGISDALKCCIERTLHDVNIQTYTSPDKLLSLFEPCEPYHTNKATPILKPVLKFFTSANKSIEEKICRQAYCEKSVNKWYLIYIIVLSLTLLVAIIGNILVCTVVIKSRSLKKRATNWFLMSLAVSDFCCSVSLLPIKISSAVTKGNFCDDLVVCQMYHFADHIFFAASVTHLFVVCVDRYTAIVKPYQYFSIFTYNRRKSLLIAVWMYAALWTLISSFNTERMNFSDTYYISVFRCKLRNGNVMCFMYLVVFFLPCSVMAGLYGRILSIALSQAKEIRKQHKPYKRLLKEEKRAPSTTFLNPSSCNLRISNQNLSQTIQPNAMVKNRQKNLATRRLEFKATKVILTVFGTYLLCWSPVIIMVTINNFSKINIDATTFKIFCDFLPNLNSALNPFIYCFMHKDFQKALKHIIRRILLSDDHNRIRKRSKNMRSSFTLEINSEMRVDHENSMSISTRF